MKVPRFVIAVILCVLGVACSTKPHPATALSQAVAPAARFRPVTGNVEQPATAPVSGPNAAIPKADQAPTTPKILQSDQTEGPFHFGDQTFSLVKHVLKIEGQASDSSVEWWEIRDSQGTAVLHQQYGKPAVENGSFEETEDVDARELKTGLGRGFLIQGISLPSAPGSEWWIQVFGLVNGKLVAMGAPMSANGEFLEENTDSVQLSAMFRGQLPQVVKEDVLEFRLWTGNFSIVYKVLIDWNQATVRPALTCYRMSSKGQISACRYKVQADPTRPKDLTFVRLFPEPDDGFTAKHAVVKPESKIEYIEAETPVTWNADEKNIDFGVTNSGKIWLHIRVDGQDGWIMGEEDFEAVGLPQSG